jgi:hypothetical protein
MSRLLAGEIVKNAARSGAESDFRPKIFIIFFWLECAIDA